MAIVKRDILSLASSKPDYPPLSGGRIEAVDLVRGAAVALMILNHGVKGLLPFEDFPQWGLVPVHMLTRFASSSFIMIFGVGLALAYLPRVQSPDWPRRRLKLVLTGVTIFFWYKVLTVLEMLPFEPEQIVEALLYQRFPSFVEILGFYAIALLWVPFFLPLWRRMPLWLRVLCPVLVTVVSYLLREHFHFWGSTIFQAFLVEHEDHYAWGQISRAPLIFLGLLLGEALARYHSDPLARRRLTAALAIAAATLFATFAALSGSDLYAEMLAIARNEGKHPPELMFMLFSIGGACAMLSAAISGGQTLARWLKPLTIIGRDALGAFIFHIAVIFVGFRYLLGYWHETTYSHALVLTICLIFATALWLKLRDWVRAHS